MIMKANKQIGFIYKDDESIDRILKDGEVVFERGFLREKTSTTLPITFGGVGKDLKDYKIYSNTYQNSTSGKNLISLIPHAANGITSFYDKETGKMSFNGTPTQQWISIESKHTVSIPAGTYTLSLKESKSFRIIVRCYTDNTNYEGISISANSKSSTKTFSNNVIATQIWIQLVVGTTYDEELYLQLEEDSVATEFEPYTGGQPSPNPDYPQEIISCGDRTKNLFDKDTTNVLNAYFDSSHINITADTTNKVIYLPCEPSTTYSITQGASSLSNHLLQIGATNTKPEIGTTTYSFEDHRNDLTFTYTTNSTAKYIIIRLRNGDYTDSTYMSTVQLEEGSTATSYEPYGYKIPINVNNVITNIYLDEPLRKIDEYSDYIDFINGKVVRNIEEYTLIGDEQIKMIREGMNCIKIDGKNIRTETLTMPPIFCNMLLANSRDSIYRGNVGIGYGAINNEYYNDIVMRVPNITTLTDFTTWLQSNNVIVDYVLATPTEESITLPNIPTIDGNNTLNIETEITPSQVYIKYKSNE